MFQSSNYVPKKPYNKLYQRPLAMALNLLASLSICFIKVVTIKLVDKNHMVHNKKATNTQNLFNLMEKKYLQDCR